MGMGMGMGADADSGVLALVLAAGQGRRFGSDKRRALLADGTPLLVATLRQAQRQFAQVFVLLRDGDDAQSLGVPAGVEVLRCPAADAEQGMGHSLAAGVNALQAQSAHSIAVLLGDMPWLSAGTLGLLLEHAGSQRIVFPLYQGRRGHPVVFGRQFWPQLQQLSGDSGAKGVLAAEPQACVAVPVDDPGVCADVDSPAALLG
jgi:molybdenum cofactor cytidylyltransferase